MSHVTLEHFLVVGAALFTLGMVCVITRRNAVAILIGIELIINAAALNLIAFSHYGHQTISGSIFVLFIIVLAAAEAVVALALILALQRRLRTVDMDQTTTLKG
jgi:NADH-quinone oxidoreductase subunit K